MKNRIIIAVSSAIILLLQTQMCQADLVYMTDFSTAYTSSTGAIALGGAAPDVVAEDWFGSSNNVGVAGDQLSLGNTTSNRTRGSAVWLDTTGWAVGLVTVDIDVSNFAAGTGGGIVFFQAYSATGVDGTDNVTMDLHGSASAGIGTTASGGATIGTLGAQQAITANGTDIPFTFNYTGAEQFVGLTFAHFTPTTGATASTADIDNLEVNTFMAVPEPSSCMVIVAAFGMLAMRRRRG